MVSSIVLVEYLYLRYLIFKNHGLILDNISNLKQATNPQKFYIVWLACYCLIFFQAHLTSNLALSRSLKYKNWKEEHLFLACEAVKQGMSLRQAEEEYGIPKSTIQDRVSGKILFGSRSGPTPYLNDAEEEKLAMFLEGSASIGYPYTRKKVIALVQKVVDEKGRNVVVTSGWWEGFCKRHTHLSLRCAEQLSRVRYNCSNPESLNKYFDLLERTILENDLAAKPCQIFNCDETGMPLDPKPPKVIVHRGTKHPRAITSGDKTQITVLACCNAAGYVIPPFVIFDRKSIKPEMCDGEVPGTMYGMSDSGWINGELFDQWFHYHFLPHAPASRPLLLLLDGHLSHFTPSVIRKAAEEQVVVSYETQPLDKGPFSPLKSHWREACRQFLHDNPGKVISRFTFSKVFGKVWGKAMCMENIISGFRCTGLYPVDRNKLIVKNEMPKKSTLGECTRVNFIPLFSPRRRSTVNDTMFTPDEHIIYQKRYDEGYDLQTDTKYKKWKSMYI